MEQETQTANEKSQQQKFKQDDCRMGFDHAILYDTDILETRIKELTSYFLKVVTHMKIHKSLSVE